MGDHAHKTRHEIWLGLWFVFGGGKYFPPDLCLVTQIAFDGVAEAAHSMSRVRRERYALGRGAISLGSSSSMVLRDGSSLSG